MQFWKGNRTDLEYTVAPEDVAEKFWVSPFGVNFLAQDPEAPRFDLSNALRRYVSAKEGMNSSFEPSDYPALLRVVQVHQPGVTLHDLDPAIWDEISQDLGREFQGSPNPTEKG